MGYVKVSISEGDLLTLPCSIAFVKHIDAQVCEPERVLNLKLGGHLDALNGAGGKHEFDKVDTNGVLPFPSLYMLNFYDEDLPFSYGSLDSYARRMIRYAVKEKAISIASVIHGPGAGIDALRATETLLSAFRREFVLRSGDLNCLQEIILIEKDPTVYRHLQDYIPFLRRNRDYLVALGNELFINPAIDADADADLQAHHSPSRHAFVAMRFQKTLNNVYNYGIKGAVEKHNLVCERLDKDSFTGDIVERIKNRIASAAFVIADITGESPNVFYEVGYADALKKPVILVSQSKEIPFDIYTHNCIFYQPDDIASLEEKLSKMIAGLLTDAAGEAPQP